MDPETMEPAGYGAGYAEGIRLERKRCQAILESPEAEGRWQAAKVLALETDMPAEAALAALVKMPADPPPEASRFPF